jgi:hypothetical protein
MNRVANLLKVLTWLSINGGILVRLNDDRPMQNIQDHFLGFNPVTPELPVKNNFAEMKCIMTKDTIDACPCSHEKWRYTII